MVQRASLGELSDRTNQPVFASDPRTVRVSLDPGEGIDEHSHPGTDILFVVVEGALELQLDDERYETTGGDLLRFDGERTIAGEASEPTTVLVVLVERRTAGDTEST